ncbi:EAL domain-containing protein [Aeromonas finlandensis]|uniref:EAL domain-containing protein n=1 Tax=Aeromonas finlandensis TaxID=1543375 RepID=UPI00051BFA7C|nr:EAL domain-containing protein [Aeromonas finlandensis]
MFFLRMDLSRTKLRFFSALLVFSLSLSAGGWVIHTNYEHHLQMVSRASAVKAVNMMDSMLDVAERANREVLPLVEQPCVDNLFILRKKAALEPFLRGIILVHDGVQYCSSLLGEIHNMDDSSVYIKRKLLLINGNQVQQNHALLLLRSDSGKNATLSSIDGGQIAFMLALSGNSRELFLRVGSVWIDEFGRFLRSSPTHPALHSGSSLELTSAHYPFTIYVGNVMPQYWLSFWKAEYQILLLLIGFSLLLTQLVWLLLGRPASQVDDLRRALKANEFIPYLQPLFASDDHRMIGVEVLMRWRHATEGLIRPDLFIPQAEESGLIVPMTDHIIRGVARRLSRIESLLPDNFHIGFNICAAHCHDFSLLEECRLFLAQFTPGKVVLVLELTERELLVANTQTLSLFRQLNDMGVKLAIDDFGTGHSSLVYLQQFHVDYLKIDKSFVTRIGTESLSEHIVDNVIDLATRLGLALVAEGVETESQAAYLRSKGVDYLQGYLFARPMSLRQFCDELLPGGRKQQL